MDRWRTDEERMFVSMHSLGGFRKVRSWPGIMMYKIEDIGEEEMADRL